MRRLVLAALLVLLVFGATARAAPYDAQIAFSEGRYTDIIEQAEQDQSADMLAFAARALLAGLMSAPEQVVRIEQAQAAERFARRALAENDEHVEARLQLAIALSLQAQTMSTREAMKSGLGGEAKDLVKSVLSDEPDNAYAHAFLSVWNVEVVRRGGGIGSRLMRASVTKGREHYAMAIAQHGDDAAIHWQFAKALTALNAKKYRSDIDQALAAAIAARPDSMVETVMRERAIILRTALETQARQYCEQLAERML